MDADLRSYFGTIDQEKLLEMVRERISYRRAVKLIRQWLRAGVMEDGTVRETLAGTPQGGVISPLLAHIYLHYLDRLWAEPCGSLGELIRYAGDFVVIRRPVPEEPSAQLHLFQMDNFQRLYAPDAPASARQATLERLRQHCSWRRRNGFGPVAFQLCGSRPVMPSPRNSLKP